MTRFTVVRFNVKNLIGTDQEYYRFQSDTPEEYAWKRDWLADQMVMLDADIVGFQEVFDEETLSDVTTLADQYGEAQNDLSLPDCTKRHRKRAIFDKLAYGSYRKAEIAFAPNMNDTGEAGQRCPGVAILSRYGFADEPEIIQDMGAPLDIPFSDGGEDSGFFRISRLSSPILKVRIQVGDHVITVFNCHLKSKLGEFKRPEDGGHAPEVDLTHYDPVGRALGSARAAMRRMMAEAWVLRGAILQELQAGNPVMVLGDFNDAENAVSSEIISGEHPFKNYQWMLRHDAEHRGDRYSVEEATNITEDIEAVRLHAAEQLFVRKSLRDMIFTAAFGGVYERIDQIYLSRHFLPETDGNIGEMEYFSVLNDHLPDGSHAEVPYNKLASDHDQIMAHMTLKGDPR